MKRSIVAGGLGVALLSIGGVSSVSAGQPAIFPPDGPIPGTKITSASTYQSVNTFWTQVDTRPDGTPVPPGVATFGNVHVGFMDASVNNSTTTIKVPGQKKTTETFGGTFAFAQIIDFDCPVGVLPPTGGGHGIAADISKLVTEAAGDPSKAQAVAIAAAEAVVEPPAGECTHIGVRFGESEPGGLVITIAPDMSRATAVGNLVIRSGGDPHSGEPGTIVGRPRVDAVWTGTGDIGYSENEGSFRRGTQVSEYEGQSQNRDADMSGILGPMGFAPGLSGGSMYSGSDSGVQKF